MSAVNHCPIFICIADYSQKNHDVKRPPHYVSLTRDAFHTAICVERE
jgi:hypothetical protein